MSDVNVPGYLESPLSYVFTAIYSALEDTSPIPMSVNQRDNEEDPDSTKTVLFKAKIHVDRNKRTQIRLIAFTLIPRNDKSLFRILGTNSNTSS